MPMGDVINLLDRRLYTFAQVDDLLSLSPSTAQRWIDGYSRQGKDYRPVVRRNSTGIAVATWGEFVSVASYLSSSRWGSDAALEARLRAVAMNSKRRIHLRPPVFGSNPGARNRGPRAG